MLHKISLFCLILLVVAGCATKHYTESYLLHGKDLKRTSWPFFSSEPAQIDSGGYTFRTHGAVDIEYGEGKYEVSNEKLAATGVFFVEHEHGDTIERGGEQVFRVEGSDLEVTDSLEISSIDFSIENADIMLNSGSQYTITGVSKIKAPKNEEEKIPEGILLEKSEFEFSGSCHVDAEEKIVLGRESGEPHASIKGKAILLRLSDGNTMRVNGEVRFLGGDLKISSIANLAIPQGVLEKGTIGLEKNKTKLSDVDGELSAGAVKVDGFAQSDEGAEQTTRTFTMDNDSDKTISLKNAAISVSEGSLSVQSAAFEDVAVSLSLTDSLALTVDRFEVKKADRIIVKGDIRVLGKTKPQATVSESDSGDELTPNGAPIYSGDSLSLEMKTGGFSIQGGEAFEYQHQNEDFLNVKLGNDDAEKIELRLSFQDYHEPEVTLSAKWSDITIEGATLKYEGGDVQVNSTDGSVHLRGGKATIANAKFTIDKSSTTQFIGFGEKYSRFGKGDKELTMLFPDEFDMNLFESTEFGLDKSDYTQNTIGNNKIRIFKDSVFTIKVKEFNPGWIHQETRKSPPRKKQREELSKRTEATARRGKNDDTSRMEGSLLSAYDWKHEEATYLGGKELWLMATIYPQDKDDVLGLKTQRSYASTAVQLNSRSFDAVTLGFEDERIFVHESDRDYLVTFTLFEVDGLELKSILLRLGTDNPGLSGLAQSGWKMFKSTAGSIVGDTIESFWEHESKTPLFYERQLLNLGATIEFQGTIALERINRSINDFQDSPEPIRNKFILLDPLKLKFSENIELGDELIHVDLDLFGELEKKGFSVELYQPDDDENPDDVLADKRERKEIVIQGDWESFSLSTDEDKDPDTDETDREMSRAKKSETRSNSWIWRGEDKSEKPTTARDTKSDEKQILELVSKEDIQVTISNGFKYRIRGEEVETNQIEISNRTGECEIDFKLNDLLGEVVGYKRYDTNRYGVSNFAYGSKFEGDSSVIEKPYELVFKDKDGVRILPPKNGEIRFRLKSSKGKILFYSMSTIDEGYSYGNIESYRSVQKNLERFFKNIDGPDDLVKHSYLYFDVVQIPDPKVLMKSSNGREQLKSLWLEEEEHSTKISSAQNDLFAIQEKLKMTLNNIIKDRRDINLLEYEIMERKRQHNRRNAADVLGVGATDGENLLAEINKKQSKIQALRDEIKIQLENKEKHEKEIERRRKLIEKLKKGSNPIFKTFELMTKQTD